MILDLLSIAAIATLVGVAVYRFLGWLNARAQRSQPPKPPTHRAG